MATLRLWNLGFRYKFVEFPNNTLLHINDASLERGGVFDLNGNWKPKHHEHRKGTVVDIRANLRYGAVPAIAFNRFIEIAANLGMNAGLHFERDEDNNPIVSTRHFHVRLFGTKE